MNHLECFYDVDPSSVDYDPSGFLVCKKAKAYLLQNGTRYPEPARISKKDGKRIAKLWPEEDPGNDRFINQMMFVIPNYDKHHDEKKILLWGEQTISWLETDVKCPVNSCQLTTNKSHRQDVDLIVFWEEHFEPSNQTRPSNQLYAYCHIESPFITEPVEYPDVFNWSITYRQDSTIAIPYAKWIYYDPRIKQKEQEKNYASNKKKKIAWFVSHCKTGNKRENYVKELQKHIGVDIYGRCGPNKCLKNNHIRHVEACFDAALNDYKFYLAFETSNCEGYITEKLWENGLSRDILPIVMGARKEEYEKLAPFRSFIHVEDFASPKQLADYLHLLDEDDDLYNSYFRWKGTGEIISTWDKIWCQMCALLNDDWGMSKRRWYKDINKWWRGPGVCTQELWRNDKLLNYSQRTPETFGK